MKIILETERLRLVELTTSDTAFITTLTNTEGWMKFIGNRNTRTEEGALLYLAGPIKSYRDHGFGLAKIECIEDGRPIGICGVIQRDYLDTPDIGYALLPEFEGKGYAFEMVHAVVQHALNILKLGNLLGFTSQDNEASIRILEKAGFVYRKEFVMPGETEVLKLFSIYPI